MAFTLFMVVMVEWFDAFCKGIHNIEKRTLLADHNSQCVPNLNACRQFYAATMDKMLTGITDQEPTKE